MFSLIRSDGPSGGPKGKAVPCDEYCKKYKLNFSLLATPAEGIAGRFTKIDKKEFGIIPGVTDREFYTNSFHVPVYYPISAFNKIDIEAPYHNLCNAGHITYIELDGDPSQNIAAFESVIRKMHDSGIGCGSGSSEIKEKAPTMTR